jgi:hypothetical protein
MFTLGTLSFTLGNITVQNEKATEAERLARSGCHVEQETKLLSAIALLHPHHPSTLG